MDVTNKGQKVGIFIAQDGFIAIFKEMAGALMPPVEVLGVPREELSHCRGDAVSAALKKEMYVVAHESPSVDRALSFCNGVA